MSPFTPWHTPQIGFDSTQPPPTHTPTHTQLPVGKDYRLGGRAVRRAISRNTVLVVASAPGFPHGVMDHVTEIAAAAAARGVPCHVDCCLGGFVLPFAARLGRRVPPFDFSVPGVTSISADTHKFGQGHKGTSVVLYRSKDIRCGWFGGGWIGGVEGCLVASRAKEVLGGLKGLEAL